MCTALSDHEIFTVFIADVGRNTRFTDRHIHIVGLTVVDDRTGNGGVFCLRGIHETVIRERARDIKHVVFSIGTNTQDRFALEVFGVIAVDAVGDFGAVRHRALDIGRVPNGGAGVGVFTALSNHEIFTVFIARVNGSCSGLDRHVLVTGLTIVGQITRHHHRFSVFGINRAVIDVHAADFITFAIGFGSELIQTTFVHGDRVPNGFTLDPVLAARGDMKRITLFRTGCNHRALRAVVVGGDDQVIKG